MIVVALTGLMRAGKDSVADILVRDHGFVKMSFAAPLKRMMFNLNPVVGHQMKSEKANGILRFRSDPVYLQDLYDRGMTDDEIKASKYGDEVRRLWQRFGTDVMRAEDDAYWIKKARSDMFASGHDRVVFTDCRFPNEADMVFELSGTHVGDTYENADHIQSSVWQINRPGVERQEGGHVSEQWVGRMGEEVTIENDGTLDDLAESVKTALDFVLQQYAPEDWVQDEFLRIFSLAAREDK